MKTFLIIVLLVALSTAWNKKLFRLFPGPIISRYGYGLGTGGYGLYRGYGPVYGGYSPVYKLRPLNKLGFGLSHYIGKRETDSIPTVNEERKPKNLFAQGYPFYGGFGNVPYGYFNRGNGFYYPSFNTYNPYYYGSSYPWYNYW